MSEQAKCPKCGAAFLPQHRQNDPADFTCGSIIELGGRITHSDLCRIRELEVEVERLRDELTAEKVEVLRLLKAITKFIDAEKAASAAGR